MHFRASLKPTSTIAQRKLRGGQKVAVLHGVKFRLKAGRFVADDVPDDLVTAFQDSPFIILEASGVRIPHALAPPVNEPVPAPPEDPPADLEEDESESDDDDILRSLGLDESGEDTTAPRKLGRPRKKP